MAKGGKKGGKKGGSAKPAPVPVPEIPDVPDMESSPGSSRSGSPQMPAPAPVPSGKASTKASRRTAALTDEQQDTMFEWLEQTPAIYDQTHPDHKRKSQLFGEQAQRMGEGLQGTTLELWFKSCRTMVSKLKKKKSGTNFIPEVNGTPNQKRLWMKMPWLIRHIQAPRRQTLQSVSTCFLLIS